MTRVSACVALLMAVPAATSCAKGETPELACQKRIAAAREAPNVGEGSFGAETYAAIDRAGCTVHQLERLDRIIALTKALPGLTETNNQLGDGKDEAAHMAAFQRMNDAVIELNALEQGVQTDLEAMSRTR